MPRISKNQPYIVYTITPDNKLRNITYNTWKEALQYTAMSLVDNGYATKKEAQEWQAAISRCGPQMFKFQKVEPGAPHYLFDIVPVSRAEELATLPYLYAQWNLKDES